jgi:hypothetical protein
MKKIVFLIALLVTGFIKTYTQVVSDVAFAQSGKHIEIYYDLTGAKYYQYFSVALYVSIDGGLTYQGPFSQVKGDIGPEIAEGTNKKIIWDVLNEMPDFGGNVKFDVRATVMEKKVKNRIFVGYKGSYTAPIGLVAGMTGKIGFYVSGRLNPGYFESVGYETDGNSITNYDQAGYYTFLSDDKIQRLSVTGGVQLQLGWKVHIYAGGGFAQYNLLWHIQQYDYPETPKGKQWVKHTGESFVSYEAEAGIMLQLKRFFITAGAASPNLEWVDITIGAGVVF